MRLPLVPIDKANHAIWTAAGVLPLMALGRYLQLSPALIVSGTGLLALLVAGAKEWLDSRGHGTPEAWDVVAGMSGWAFLAAAYLLGGR